MESYINELRAARAQVAALRERLTAAEEHAATAEIALRAATLPAGTVEYCFESYYSGAHEEMGHGDETLVVAVPEGTDMSGVGFSHDSYSRRDWVAQFRRLPGAWFWNGEKWVPAESMSAKWGG